VAPSARHPPPLTTLSNHQSRQQRAEAVVRSGISWLHQLQRFGGDVAQAPRTWFEPITVFGGGDRRRQSGRLIATAISTTYTESRCPQPGPPIFALPIDHISARGRAAHRHVMARQSGRARKITGGIGGGEAYADRYKLR